MRNTGQHSRTGSAPETQHGLSSLAFSNARSASLSEKSITFPGRSVEANAASISGDTLPERATAAQVTTPVASWLMPDTTAGSGDVAKLIAATEHPLAARARRDIGTEAHAAESSAEIMRHQIDSVRTLLYRAGLPHDAPVEGNNVPLVNSVVQYLSKSPAHASKLAQHLCRVTHEYGGRRNETLSESRVQSKIADWLSTLAFGSPAETFVTDQLAALVHEGNEGAPPFVENARHRLQDFIGATNRWLSAPDALTKKYFNENVLDGIAPAVRWQPTDDQRFGLDEICNLEWGYIHAALRFAKDIGLDTHAWGTQDAIEVGQALATLCDEAVVPPEWQDYFVLPAQLHALREGSKAPGNSNPDAAVQERVSRETALRLFFEARNADRQHNDPFIRLQQSLENFKTRPALAKAILQEKCPGLGTEEVYETKANQYLDADKQYCLVFPPGARSSDVPRKVIELPKINDEFAEQNRRIAEQHGDVDRVLLPLAFAQLNAEEAAFIERAEVHQAEATLSAAHTIRGTLLAANRHAIEGLTKRMPQNLELFSAQHNGEERIYALYPKPGMGYSVERVDRKEDFYHGLYEESTGVSLRHDKDYRLRVTRLRDVLKDSTSDMSTLYNVIRQQHENQLQERLHAYGYAKTTYEKVKDFALSLVPFYECVKEIRHGKAGAAVLPCTLDVIGLIPLAGRAAGVGMRFGEALSFSALTALRQSSASSVIRQMALAGSKTLTATSLGELATGAVRAVDPGIELIAVGGKAGMRKAQKLLTAMRDIYPGAEKVATALGRRADSWVEPATSAIVKGQLPGLTHAWDMVKVEQRKGKDVFVRILPQTGDKFGKKYYRDADGKLQPVYSWLGERLHIVRQQGLGGRGSKAAPRAWARQDAARQAERGDHLDPQRAEPLRAPESPQAIYADEIAERAPHAALPNTVELLQLPNEMLEKIVLNCDLATLASLYETSRQLRAIVSQVFQSKWQDRTDYAAVHTAIEDQSVLLRFLAAQNVKIDDLSVNGEPLLAVALRYNLDTETFRRLFDLADTINGKIIPNPFVPQIEFWNLYLLQAAAAENNMHAVKALLDYERHVIPPQNAGILHIAARVQNLEMFKLLVETGHFDINARDASGSTVLQQELFNPKNTDNAVFRYLLSRDDIEINDPSVFMNTFSPNPEKYRIWLADPRVDVNVELPADSNGVRYTPLSTDIRQAVMFDSFMTKFDLLVAEPRVDVLKTSLWPDGTRRTPEEVLDCSVRDYRGQLLGFFDNRLVRHIRKRLHNRLRADHDV